MGPGRPLLVLADSPADESDRTDGALAPIDRDAEADTEPGDAAEVSPPATGRS